MYNENIKMQFVSYNMTNNISSDVYGIRLFNDIEPFEKRVNKDCCCFTIKEIIDFYKSKQFVSFESINVMNCFLKSYTDWCNERNMVVDNQNHYIQSEVTSEVIMSCINFGVFNDRIISKDNLNVILKNLLNSSDKALLLALFEGICGTNMSELINLSTSQISGNTVHLQNDFSTEQRTLDISNELIDLCKEAEETYEYYHDYKNRVDKLCIDDRGVFKCRDTINSTGVNRKVLYNKLAKIKRDSNLLYLTTFSLMESGRINMLNNMDYTDISEALKLTYYRYGAIQSRKIWIEKYGKHLNM